MGLGTPHVTIVDYGLGNLRSVSKAFGALGASAVVSSNPWEIANADYLVLPGVGAFQDGMSGLRQRGLVEAIREFAGKERPLLGICLGMQLFMTEGFEFGHHEGLDLIPGSVVPLKPRLTVKIPHIGWSGLQGPGSDGFQGEGKIFRREWEGTILEKIEAGSEVYFVHSYVAEPKTGEFILASSVYGGGEFCAVVQKDNITGCQFHPEKSGRVGLEMLKRFFTMPLGMGRLS